MDRENETSPLLYTFPTRDSRARRFCRRLPPELTITGVILGLFLLVITLLVVLENLKSPVEKELSLRSELLASPLKYNKKPNTYSWENRDLNKNSDEFIHIVQEKEDDLFGNWQKSHKIDDHDQQVDIEKKILEFVQELEELPGKKRTFEEILETFQENIADEDKESEETALLGSPYKYNKKIVDESWQNKKSIYSKKDKNAIDVDQNAKERLKKSFPFSYLQQSFGKEFDAEHETIGSPLKYNKKDLDDTWQKKKSKYFEKYDGFDDRKWDTVDKGWKKISSLGSPFMIDREMFEKNENKALEVKNSRPERKEFKLSELGSPFMVDRDIFEKTETNFNFDEKKIDDSTENYWKLIKIAKKWIMEKKKMDNAWRKAKENLTSTVQLFKKKGTECKTNYNKSGAATMGCPSLNLRDKLLGATMSEEPRLNCAMIMDNAHRNFGECIDLSFLPKECKPSWNNKCFSTYKYRKIDGSCNNQIHPTWGKSGTPFVRMVAPAYGDGVSSLRFSKNGKDLPNARLLSQKLYSEKLKADSEATLLFLAFGLIIDHDMVETGINRGGIPCCSESFKKYPQSRPKECLQIDVSEKDPFYGSRNVTCLNLIRSLPVHGECGGRREQLNKATSYLDGSTVYGSSIEKTKSLRSFRKGQLKTQEINGMPFMEFSEGAGYSCGTTSQPLKCFEAGDSRVNMIVILTAMHVLWYREHNRLAEELFKINPKWTDETLFQEARKILISEIQHITYNEFLPLLLGNEAMEYFQLSVKRFHNDYDDTVNPSVFNVFGAAAFRFGHSLLQDKLRLIDMENKTIEMVPVHETYFNLRILYQGHLDHLLNGALSQKLHSVDSFITEEVREHLFQQAGKDFGHDLAAVGIQRGRDHGLPSYIKWRIVCGLSEITSWNDLKNVMPEKRVIKLQEIYDSVEDIDLIPGALAENHVEGSLLGSTYVCLIGRQFKKTRVGDRFWFETQGRLGSFTKDQLQEIYNSNIARIVCDNSDNIQKIQKFPFKIPSLSNPDINCSDISKIDLSKWKATY